MLASEEHDLTGRLPKLTKKTNNHNWRMNDTSDRTLDKKLLDSLVSKKLIIWSILCEEYDNQT